MSFFGVRPTFYRRLVGALASSALLSASVLAALAPVACVALVPLCLVCARSSWRGAALLGATTGTVYSLAISTWIPEALRGYGATPNEAFVGFLAVALWSGAPAFAALGLAARGLGQSALLGTAVFACCVFGAEWIVSRAWWGVPWWLLGYTQAGAPGVMQLAAVGGVPLVSALLAGTSAAVAAGLSGLPGGLRLAVALLSSWVSLAAFGLPLAQLLTPLGTPTEPARLLALQPNLPRSERWVPSSQLLNLHRLRRSFEPLLQAEDLHGISAILLPENLLTEPLEANAAMRRELARWVDGLGTPALIGAVRSAKSGEPGRYRSSVVWIEPGEGLTASLDKTRAIPVLESSRRFFGRSVFAWAFGRAADLPRVEEDSQTKPLEGPMPLVVALCFEVLFPGIVADRRTEDSVAIVNLADDSWVTGEAATRHLTLISRFRAVEQRLPLIRVAHGGLSAEVDAFGRIVQALPMDEYGAMRVSLQPGRFPKPVEHLALLCLPVGTWLVVWWCPWVPLGHRRQEAE